jgi:MFS family permease
MRTRSSTLGRNRIGLSVYFCLTGTLSALWGATLPATDVRLDLGPGRLGSLLLILGVSALITMPCAGWLADRWTSRRLLRTSASACAIALIGPALAPSFELLACFVFGLGVLLGAVNVALTAQAVELEGRYDKPIIATLHGMWTLGAVLGGGVTALSLRAGSDVRVVMASGALVVCLLFLTHGVLLARNGPRSAAPADKAGSRAAGPRTGLLILLGAMGAAAFISEGTATDWAGVYARRVLGADPAAASLAYTIFFAAMTAMRFAGDRVRGYAGPARSILLCGIAASAGYGLVLLAPVTGWARLGYAYVGWGMVGIGMALVWPIVTSAIGTVETGTARGLSAITTISYGGSLIGPAVVGYVATAASLPVAIVIPATLSGLVALTGPLVLEPITRPAPPRMGVSSSRPKLVAPPAPPSDCRTLRRHP